MAAPNPVYSYNHGLVTPSKGCAIECFRVTGLNNASPTVDDGKALFVNSCTKSPTGTYTFQLNQPYPPSIICVQPELSQANGSTAILTAQYKSASYNATTGQFVIFVMTGNATPSLADGGATDEMHVVMFVRRYTT